LNTKHDPVLLHETINLLNLQPGDVVVDGTLGLGGHAQTILERIGSDGHYYGFDLDETNLKSAQNRLKPFESQTTFFHSNFVHCQHRLQEINVGSVDKILLDLGVSSPHFDDPERGFSIKENGPLDMRFDRSTGQTAADIVNRWPEEDLKQIFYEYGEERYAPKVARMIKERRKANPFKTTFDVTDMISEIMKNPKDKRQVSTRIFQALRIAVNDELDVLQEAIDTMLPLLKPGGRMVVISFHSLEDRIVKHTFRNAAKTGDFKLLTKKPITPSHEEIENNSRSRSSKLRGIERL
jgi:16S rRNA (cytosine1402-N4)-methyltransferase